MSTPCIVSCHTEDGYLSIYVHNDGYPDHMFPLLRDWYGTKERAESLVEFGDASYIDKRLIPSVGSGHCFDKPEDGVCVFYHRDRGEPWVRTAPAVYQKCQVVNAHHYVYIFENGQWVMYIGGKEAVYSADCE